MPLLSTVRRFIWIALAFGALCVVSCGFDPLDRCAAARAAQSFSCPLPGFTDRAFDLATPAQWNGRDPLPLIVAFHGGGGNRKAAAKTTCPEGNETSPDCLRAKALSAGFAIVFPDGTGTRPLRNARTWNAGGGRDGWQCVSGGACNAGVDDVQYFDALVAELKLVVPIDESRIFLTGLSNGAAISHRLACERPTVVAAFAAIGGGNQHAAAGGVCAGGPAVLMIHGTEDPCWRFADSTEACAQLDGGRKVGVNASLAGWRQRNGCSDSSVLADIPDRDPKDGTRSTHQRFADCRSSVELITVEGGGHTWPGGHGYLSPAVIGRVSRDFDADDLILEFFRAHPKR